MDTLAYVGKGFSTFQFITTSLLGALLIVIAVLLFISASKGEEPIVDPLHPPISKNTKIGIGIGCLIFGFIFPYAAWINRKLVRGNDKYAAFNGGINMFRMAVNGGRRR